jgi:lysophospholipase L1-like esterase
MILNPNAKKIICFGDSLTWGHFHGGVRYPLRDRWTYKLQELLGEDFDVIEEGLNSRTTNIDDEHIADRNGLPYFRACFESQYPASHLVYMLGTNDTKTKFNHPIESSVVEIGKKIDWVRAYDAEKKGQTKIILLAPPLINVAHLSPKLKTLFDANSNEKLIALARHLEKLAEEKNVDFVDLSKDIIAAENDGVHLSVEDNARIASLIRPLIS